MASGQGPSRRDTRPHSLSKDEAYARQLQEEENAAAIEVWTEYLMISDPKDTSVNIFLNLTNLADIRWNPTLTLLTLPIISPVIWQYNLILTYILMTSVLFILDKHACTIIILIGEIFTKKKQTIKDHMLNTWWIPKHKGIEI